jgi:hypothetical protein
MQNPRYAIERRQPIGKCGITDEEQPSHHSGAATATASADAAMALDDRNGKPDAASSGQSDRPIADGPSTKTGRTNPVTQPRPQPKIPRHSTPSIDSTRFLSSWEADETRGTCAWTSISQCLNQPQTHSQ